MIDRCPRTTLVLDASEECDFDTRSQLTEFFKELVEESTHLLTVFVASRKEPVVESCLTSVRDQQMLVEISAEDNKADIEKFVNEKLIEVKKFWKFDEEHLDQLVKDTLLAKSDATFRWTHLQCERLKKCRTMKAVQEKLTTLSTTLSSAYDEIYNDPELGMYNRRMLERAVRWVTFSRRPLDSCAPLSAIRAESERTDGENAFRRSDLTEEILE